LSPEGLSNGGETHLFVVWCILFDVSVHRIAELQSDMPAVGAMNSGEDENPTKGMWLLMVGIRAFHYSRGDKPWPKDHRTATVLELAIRMGTPIATIAKAFGMRIGKQ
jgi:hypothetical protein